jgi:hypothetical protein
MGSMPPVHGPVEIPLGAARRTVTHTPRAASQESTLVEKVPVTVRSRHTLPDLNGACGLPARLSNKGFTAWQTGSGRSHSTR